MVSRHTTAPRNGAGNIPVSRQRGYGPVRPPFATQRGAPGAFVLDRGSPGQPTCGAMRDVLAILRRPAPCLVAMALASSACDLVSRAQGTPSVSAAASPPVACPHRSDAAVVEGETCTRTDDCPVTAHCIDGHCTLAARSYRGEVHAERGTRALATGRSTDAVTEFRAAETAYRERGVALPSAVACGLARALVGQNDRSEATGDAREVMAHALVNCIAQAPPGSAQADEALSLLASLGDRGLDVNALDRPDAALMTGHDPRPTPATTRVRVMFSGSGDGSRQVFREFAQGDPLRIEALRCFLQGWNAGRSAEDQGTLRVAYVRGTDDYDELTAPRVTVVATDVPPLPAGSDGGVSGHWLHCVATAVQAGAGALRWPARQERWSETLMISVDTGR